MFELNLSQDIKIYKLRHSCVEEKKDKVRNSIQINIVTKYNIKFNRYLLFSYK